VAVWLMPADTVTSVCTESVIVSQISSLPSADVTAFGCPVSRLVTPGRGRTSGIAEVTHFPLHAPASLILGWQTDPNRI